MSCISIPRRAHAILLPVTAPPVFAPPPAPVSHGVARAAVLAFIVLGAAHLRFVDVDFGLPSRYHPDELRASEQVARLVRGEIRLASYKHPPLLKSLAWLGTGIAQRVSPVPSRRLRLRARLALRLVSAAAGTLTVIAVFLLARRFFDDGWALVSAGIYAVLPIAVFSAKHGTPDTLMTGLFAMSIWLALLVYEAPSASRRAAAGLVFGLAVSAKYNAVFAICAIALAHVLSSRRTGRPWRAFFEPAAWIQFCGGLAIGLALGFPLLPFEFDAFMATTMAEASHLFSEGHRGLKITGPDFYYVFHFLHSVPSGMGLVLTGLAVVGIGWFAAGARRPEGWLVLAALVPYYIAMEQVYKAPPSFDRYVLPLVPLYLLGAAGIGRELTVRIGRRWPRAERASSVAIVVAMAAWPVIETTRLASDLTPDTRERMAQWINANIEPNALVLIEEPIEYYPDFSQMRVRAQSVQPRSLRPEFIRRHVDYILISSLASDRWAQFDRFRTASGGSAAFYEHIEKWGTLHHEVRPGHRQYLFHNPTLRLFRVDGDRDVRRLDAHRTYRP